MTGQERLHQVVEDRHRYAQEWKARTGGKVVGYFCTYFPEEVLYAAGILPVRVLGGHEPQDITEPYLFSMYCPYCRDCLAQGLLGRYDYLDGIAYAHSCAHIQQAFESWRRHIPIEMAYFLYFPSQPGSAGAAPLLQREIKALVRRVEEWRGAPVGSEALERAIEVYNQNRRLLSQLYTLRRPRPPGFTGSQVMEIVLASQLMDKEEHNSLLAQFLQEPQIPPHPGPRLMLVGSVEDHIELVRLFEDLGANVVADDHCTGSRYFWGEVAPGDGVAAIATRYLEKPPCPLKDFHSQHRQQHLEHLIEEYGVEGVVFLRQKFCDPHAYDQALLQDLFKERGLPTLALELDFTLPLGQFRTRVEAFLEMLKIEGG